MITIGKISNIHLTFHFISKNSILKNSMKGTNIFKLFLNAGVF